jgi:hypothetical protein
MKQAIFAIDPGASGGIAILNAALPSMPDLHPYRSPAEVARKLNAFLRWQSETWGRSIFVIEQVHASPVMSPSSAFAFGENFGIWRGLLAEQTLYGVSPSQWQAPLKLGAVQGDERKRKLKSVARERYPEAVVTLATCDALLIADYVRAEIEAKGEFTSGTIL